MEGDAPVPPPAEPPADGPAARPPSSLLRRAAWYALGVFAVLRVGLTVVSLVAVGAFPHNPEVDVPGREARPIGPGWDNLWESWERWDALWYLRIADTGYDPDDGSAAFFPLFPLLVRLLAPLLGGSELGAGLLVANACAYLSLAALYVVTARETDEPTARLAVAFLAAFPASFFLVAPYAESLFLLLSLVALGAARAGRWPVAGAAAALAASTRSLGLLLAVPLAVEAVAQARRLAPHRRIEGLALRLACAGGAPLGTSLYAAYWWRRAGNPWQWRDAQDVWQREPVWPWESLWDGTREAFRWIGVYPGGFALLDWLVAAAALAATAWVAWRTRPTWWSYVAASWLVPLSFPWPTRPLLSMPRFLLVVFPLAWAAAALARERPRLGQALLASSAALLGIMAALFVDWYWVF